MGSLRFYSFLVAGTAGAALLLGYFIRLRHKTPEQLEQQRRQRIHTNGRITDGTVIDTHESEFAGLPTQFVVYQYDVGGVSYESSQDVTQLRHLVDLHSCRIGLPASVKYDPQNPGNSIVIAEGWSGLRL